MADKTAQPAKVDMTGKILVITKNGNFMQAVKSRTQAVAALRGYATNNLGVTGVDKLDTEEKNGIIGLKGVAHFRAKIVDLV